MTEGREVYVETKQFSWVPLDMFLSHRDAECLNEATLRPCVKELGHLEDYLNVIPIGS